MHRWKHRRHQAGLHDAPLTPGQVQTLRARDQGVVTWATRVFITLLMLGSAGSIFTHGASSTLRGLYIGTAVIYLITLAATWFGRREQAGILAWTVSVLGVIVISSELSSSSQVTSILFGLGIMPFLLVPAHQAALRMSLVAVALVVYPLCLFLWPAGDGAHQVVAGAANTIAMVNALGAVAMAGSALAVMQYRLLFNRRILEGAARYGELRATTDELTGVYNRRPVISQLENYQSRGRANYAIALIDLDEFKDINDEHGHDCGDDVIKAVADALTRHFRATDMVSRWGGDEFLVVMPGIRHADLEPVLERLRHDIAALRLECPGHTHSVTVSIGAAMGHVAQSPDECIAAADHALYRAKESGRNKVITVGALRPTAALGRT